MAPDGGDGGAGDGVSAQGDEGVYGSISDTFGNNNAPDANASFADNAGWGGIGVDASDPFGATSAFGNLGGFGVDASPGLGDVGAKVGSFLEGRVNNAFNNLENAFNNPAQALATVGINGLISAVTGGVPSLIANGLVDAITGRSIGGHVSNAIFGGTPEGWSPAQDDDAGAVANAANTAFADAAGMGGLMSAPTGNPAGMGGDGGGSMYRDPQNAQIAQAIAPSAPSLFPQPQQQQSMLWQPNQWNGNQMAIPGIRFA